MSATMVMVPAVPQRAGVPSPSAAGVSGARLDPVEVAACRAAILEECARPSCNAVSLVARLLGLGFPPLAPTWELVWSWGQDRSLASALEAVGVERLDLLERLARAVPGPALRRLLEARIVSEPHAEELNWIVAYLREYGAWREVDLLLVLSAVDVHWIGLDPAQVDADVVEALRRMLARDTKTYGSLRSCVTADPEPYADVAIEALAGTSGERALFTLAYLLDDGRLDEVDLVRAVEQVGRRTLPPFDEFLLRRLRELAHEGDPHLRAASLRAAGALGDEASLPLQVEGLGDAEGAVRSAAGAALTELTGLRFGASPERWRSWYAGENDWWDERAAGVLERLDDDDPAVAIAALSELVPHRMQRGRLARAIARRLDDESPELRRLACLALEQLGSRTVALDVLERLTDVDDDVRRGAHRCLQTLFRVELPPERETWMDLLEQSDLALR